MRLLSRPPPPTPTPLPRHRRSQRPARRSQRPAQFKSGRHTTCDCYRGRHLRPPHPSPVTDGLRDPRDGPRDPRNSRAAVTPHATTIAAATSDPHTPPRHTYVTPCDCFCEVIARPTRDSLGTCEVCARKRLAQEKHSSASGCQPCHSLRSFLGAVDTRCGRVLCCVARYDASDCCAALVNFRALRWLASLGHMLFP
jgi:hypothetical protein